MLKFSDDNNNGNDTATISIPVPLFFDATNQKENQILKLEKG